MVRIRKIGYITCASVVAIMSGLGGLILSILLVLIAVVTGTSVDASAATAISGAGVFAVVFIPIVYGVGGFVAGLVLALFYNIAAKASGGMKIQLHGLEAALPEQRHPVEADAPGVPASDA